MAAFLVKLAAFLVGAGCGIATVLAAASPAEAVTYFFNSASFTYASSATGNTGGFFTGTITGSFDYNGSVTNNGPLSNVSVVFTNACTSFSSNTCNTVGTRTYSAGYWTTSVNYLYFTDNGPEPDVRLTLSDNLPFTGGSVNILPSESSARSGWRSGVTIPPTSTSFNNGTARVDFSAVSGDVVPSPLSLMMLAPFSSLLVLRRRFRPLTGKLQQA
jgi:hypothetical protein